LTSRIGGTSAESPKLRIYVSRLPIPDSAQPTRTADGIAHYKIEMTEFRQQVHRDLPPTTLWGYNGTWLGPTIETRAGRPMRVQWVNNLPNRHLLDYAYDSTIHGADMEEPPVRTVVHLHGAKVWSDSDGYPEAWFTRDRAETGSFLHHKGV
jgi:spore coat protein A